VNMNFAKNLLSVIRFNVFLNSLGLWPIVVNSLRLCSCIMMALGPKLCSNIRLILVVRGSVSTVILVPGM
jgi:hypothetical protein